MTNDIMQVVVINNCKYIEVDSTISNLIDYLQTIHGNPDYKEVYLSFTYLLKYLQMVLDSDEI